MNEIVMSILMVVAILAVCGLYFKIVIMNWLARDSALYLREVHPQLDVSPDPAHHDSHQP